MKKQLFLAFFFSLISISFLAFSARTHAQTFTTLAAVQPPGVVQVQIPKVSFKNGIVSADIQIKNDTKADITDLIYGIQILSPRKAVITKTGTESGTNPGELVGYQDYDFFSLAKGESVTKHVEYSLGNHMENGVYTMLVQVRGSDNGILGYQANTFSLSGDGQFLRIDPTTCRMTVGGTTYDLSDGPLVTKDDQAYVYCTVQNTSTTKIEVQYVVDYAIRSVSFYPTSEVAKEKPNDPVLFAPGEKKLLRLNVPVVKTPQVYQGFWYFVDTKGVRMSPIVVFRWTIPGASATILGVNSDKQAYTKGEKGIISVIVDPSADLTWREEGKGTNLNDASLQVSLLGSDGSSCGNGQMKLPKTAVAPQWPTQKVSVVITRDCPSFTVKTEVINSGKILGEVEKRYGSNALPPKIVSEKSIRSFWPLVVTILVISLVIAGIAFFIYKKRKKAASSTAVSILFLCLLFGSLFIQKAYAAEYAPVDSPIENKTVDSGGWWGNVSNFSSVSATGRSSFGVDGSCSIGTLYLYGYADQNYCSNGRPGLQAQVFIDGQPATVTNIQSPESDYTMQSNCVVFDGSNGGLRTEAGYGCPHGPYEFYLDSRSNGVGGIRTGTASISIPASAQSPGQHTAEVRVAAGGRHYSSSGGYFALSSFPPAEYIKMNLTYQCGAVTPTPTPGPACNSACIRDAECTGDAARAGCTVCLTNAAGTGTTCQPPPATPTPTPTPAGMCNQPCTAFECQGSFDGCTVCTPNPTTGTRTCQPPPTPTSTPTPTPTPIPACGSPCTTIADCSATRDGCTACVPDNTGTGSSCKPPPACGTTCVKDSQCAGARSGCNTCGSDGKCTAFSTNMCSCDGMDFAVAGGGQTFFPGSDVTFIAYGVVPGKDWKGAAVDAVNFAEIKGMKFTLYKSTLAEPNKNVQQLAQSRLIVPEIVQNDPTKVRYKVTWNQKIPSTVPAGTLFRVLAEIPSNGGCVAKPNPAVQGAHTTSFAASYYAGILRTLQGIMTNTKTVLGTTALDQQQADTFFPGARISEKSCKTILFFFD